MIPFRVLRVLSIIADAVLFFTVSAATFVITMAGAEAVPIKPGDLLADGRVLVDPSTGSQTLVSAGDVTAALANGLSLIPGSGTSEIAPNGDIVRIIGNLLTGVQIVRVNAVSGAQSTILDSSFALRGFGTPDKLEVAPGGDVWFTTRLCCLFRIDSGTGILYGPLFGLDAHPIGLEVGPKGDVFVVGADLAGIFHFDPATSTATKVGCISIIECNPRYEFADIIQGPDGTLFGASNPGLDAAKVSRVDPITGVETIISSNGLLGASSIALFVPEPPSIVLLAFGFAGLAGVVAWGRHPRT